MMKKNFSAALALIWVSAASAQTVAEILQTVSDGDTVAVHLYFYAAEVEGQHQVAQILDCGAISTAIEGEDFFSLFLTLCQEGEKILRGVRCTPDEGGGWHAILYSAEGKIEWEADVPEDEYLLPFLPAGEGEVKFYYFTSSQNPYGGRLPCRCE